MVDAYAVRFPDQPRRHLRASRKRHGLTQAQLGKRIGVSQARIAEIEAHPGLVNVEQWMKLLSVLGVSLTLQEAAVAPAAARSMSMGKAATDGHAKNFSIHLDRGDAYRMTPLYDVLSMWPYHGDGTGQLRPRKAGLAMAVRSKNAHCLFHTIQARHWKRLAVRHGGDAVWAGKSSGSRCSTRASASSTPLTSSIVAAHTWESTSSGMRGQATRFLKEAGVL